MLISIAQTELRYEVSRSTIQRRLKEGALTKHTTPDGAMTMLDIDEVERSFKRRTTDAQSADPEPERANAPAAGMAQRLVPDPEELRAAMTRAVNAPRLPRLFARRGWRLR